MLELTKGQESEALIVTLNELKTLADPYYLFVFTHGTTNRQVSFIAGEDLSPYLERYNKFEINTAAVFLGEPIGEWHYEVYEQEDDLNTDPANATGLVETGKLYLLNIEEFEYVQYNSSTTFKTYDGGSDG